MLNEFVENDTGSKIEVTCKNSSDGVVIDLSSSTVVVKWVDSTGTLQSEAMTVTDAVNGVAEYLFTGSQLEAGTTDFEFEITTGGLIISSLDLVSVKIRTELT